jgi:hypothetical protein
VTREEFEEYYNNVSMSVDDDRYFELMMNNAWKLDNAAPAKKAWAADMGGKAAGSVTAKPRQGAPWGTTEGPTSYTTSNAPSTAT